MLKKFIQGCMLALAVTIPFSAVASASPAQESLASAAEQASYYCGYQYAYVCDALGRCVWAYQYYCG